MDFFRFARKYRHLPRALRDVASLNLFVGAGAILSDLIQLLNGNLELPIGGIISVMIGVGLLDLNPLARSWQLFFLKASLYLSPLACLAALGLTAYGVISVPDLPAWKWMMTAAGVGVGFGLTVWELRVLNRPAIRELFGEHRTFATIVPPELVPGVPILPLPSQPAPTFRKQDAERLPRV
jgi:hypothetical protein